MKPQTKQELYKTAQRVDDGRFVALHYMGTLDRVHIWTGKHTDGTVKLFREHELTRFCL